MAKSRTNLNVNNNIFINCPFDDEYKPLLYAILFSTIYCGLNPLISETFDSGTNRFENIKTLIMNSRFSINDLSRMGPMKEEDIPRFNMPFELGLFIGSKYLIPKIVENNRIIIFESEKYRYQKAISDFAGNDIYVHHSDPNELIRQLRNWLTRALKPDQPSGQSIIDEYNDFLSHLEQLLIERNFSDDDIKQLTASELILFIQNWLNIKVSDNN
jgi:hypothetical protein